MLIRNGLAFRHFTIFISGQFCSPCPFAGISLSLYFALLYMEFFCLLLRDCLDSGCGFASVWFPFYPRIEAVVECKWLASLAGC